MTRPIPTVFRVTAAAAVLSLAACAAKEPSVAPSGAPLAVERKVREAPPVDGGANEVWVVMQIFDGIAPSSVDAEAAAMTVMAPGLNADQRATLGSALGEGQAAAQVLSSVDRLFDLGANQVDISASWGGAALTVRMEGRGEVGAQSGPSADFTVPKPPKSPKSD